MNILSWLLRVGPKNWILKLLSLLGLNTLRSLLWLWQCTLRICVIVSWFIWSLLCCSTVLTVLLLVEGAHTRSWLIVSSGGGLAIDRCWLTLPEVDHQVPDLPTVCALLGQLERWLASNVWNWLCLAVSLVWSICVDAVLLDHWCAHSQLESAAIARVSVASQTFGQILRQSFTQLWISVFIDTLLQGLSLKQSILFGCLAPLGRSSLEGTRSLSIESSLWLVFSEIMDF